MVPIGGVASFYDKTPSIDALQHAILNIFRSMQGDVTRIFSTIPALALPDKGPVGVRKPDIASQAFSHLCSHTMCQNSKPQHQQQRQRNLPPLSSGIPVVLSRRNLLPQVAPWRDEEEEEEDRDDSGCFFIGYYKPLAWCRDDLEKLQATSSELDQCHFYFGALDSDGARAMLRGADVGTFLVRDSSDSRFLYSLSVKTERGATSVRIRYDNGLFQFDCDSGVRDFLPRFESVLALVDFYVLLSQEGGSHVWRWEEVNGHKHMKMTLRRPHRSSVPSLGHLARVKVNQCLCDVFFPHLSVDKLDIPEHAKNFLKAYPYRS